jgi:riboflavin synthase
MFTGIVTDMGEVRRLDRRGDTHIVVATRFDVSQIDVGSSIACAGVCLTVMGKGDANDRWFEVGASAETLSRTTIGEWAAGRRINLERPLRVGDELGGHIVSGHVDGTAEIAEVRPEGESLRLTLDASHELMRFVASKGSIALDGVSLTVNETNGARFGVNVIAHTLQVTTFGAAKAGARVNLEVDLLARYVARLGGS